MIIILHAAVVTADGSQLTAIVAPISRTVVCHGITPSVTKSTAAYADQSMPRIAFAAAPDERSASNAKTIVTAVRPILAMHV